SFLGNTSSVDLSTTLSAASSINNLTLPDFTGAANGGSFNLGQSFGAVVDGIAGAFDKLNQAVKSALGANVPLVGSQLSNAVRFLSDLKDRALQGLLSLAVSQQTVTAV